MQSYPCTAPTATPPCTPQWYLSSGTSATAALLQALRRAMILTWSAGCGVADALRLGLPRDKPGTCTQRKHARELHACEPEPGNILTIFGIRLCNRVARLRTLDTSHGTTTPKRRCGDRAGHILLVLHVSASLQMPWPSVSIKSVRCENAGALYRSEDNVGALQAHRGYEGDVSTQVLLMQAPMRFRTWDFAKFSICT